MDFSFMCIDDFRLFHKLRLADNKYTLLQYKEKQTPLKVALNLLFTLCHYVTN